MSAAIKTKTESNKENRARRTPSSTIALMYTSKTWLNSKPPERQSERNQVEIEVLDTSSYQTEGPTRVTDSLSRGSTCHGVGLQTWSEGGWTCGGALGQRPY